MYRTYIFNYACALLFMLCVLLSVLKRFDCVDPLWLVPREDRLQQSVNNKNKLQEGAP